MTLASVVGQPRAIDALHAALRGGSVHHAYLFAERLQKEHKLDAPTAQLVAVMAGGSIGRALALDVKTLAARQEVIRTFEALKAGDAGSLIRWAATFGDSREDAGAGPLHPLAVDARRGDGEGGRRASGQPGSGRAAYRRDGAAEGVKGFVKLR